MKYPLLIIAALVLIGGGTIWYNTQNNNMSTASNDPNAPGREGYPQIFEAIEDRDRERVARLIAAGADVEVRGYGRGTPILKAALTHNWVMAEMLLQAGADPMVPDEFGITLPAVAARSNLKPESEEGQALDRVRAVLAEQGQVDLVFTPEEVRTMVEAGEWPPEPVLERGDGSLLFVLKLPQIISAIV